MRRSGNSFAVLIVLGVLCFGSDASGEGASSRIASDAILPDVNHPIVARDATDPGNALLTTPEPSSIAEFPGTWRQDGEDTFGVDGETASMSLEVVPEPGTALLVMMGLILLGICGSRAHRA